MACFYAEHLVRCPQHRPRNDDLPGPSLVSQYITVAGEDCFAGNPVYVLPSFPYLIKPPGKEEVWPGSRVLIATQRVCGFLCWL